ncbi:MAG: type II secretion system protein [Frankiaceae bacterium]|nr:type II secretion system protein [Frankiaceae bacterium]MBV9368255.1 type II secretion system protein [Frankiales bacterium]
MSRAAASRNDAGDTLVEIVIALAIMGIAVVAMLTGLSAVTNASALHQDHATAETYLRAAAEAVAGTNVAYDKCTGSHTPSYTLPSNPTGFQLSVALIKYWDGTSGGGTFLSSCPATGDKGAQQITLEIKSTGSPALAVDQTVTVVKGNG